MKRFITIIEDEKEIGETLGRFFEGKNYQVKHYVTAEDFFSDKNSPPQSIYLIDWNLPGIKGIDIIRTIRTHDKLSPIFMISAYNKTQEAVTGLKAGADDYITKPFNFEELAARVENSWAKMSQVEGNLMSHGIKLIPEASAVIKDGTTINLTDREFIIFAHLYSQAGKPSTREELIDQFQGAEKMTTRNVDVHVFSLRKKVAKIGMSIETVWGTGYKLLTESTVQPEV